MAHRTFDHRIAVIDIGSNSVRLVLFEGDGRFPAVAFNEKVLCGLGRNMSTSRKLDEKGMVMALQTLERFAILIKRMRVRDVRAVATAAVRAADNGSEFIEAITIRCGFKVQVLTGNEEARMSAMGVLAGIPDADGVMGDLGGGSLELVNIGPAGIGQNVSLPLGPFLLQDLMKKDKRALFAHIDDHLQRIPWFNIGRDRDFFTVGGAWRALARMHIEHTGYPLHILHHYRIPREDVLSLCTLVSSMSPQSLARIPNVAIKRAETLPFAATLLRRIFEVVKPKQLIVSALGLREGLIYSAMPEEVRKRDPLLDVCHDMAAQSGRFPEHAQALLDWTGPIFAGETVEDRRLRLATCMLSDVAWRGHPDYRADMVLLEVLYGRFGGLDHRGTALMALALYCCYGGTLDHEIAHISRILDENDFKRAELMGLSLRLGQRLSGGTSSALKLARLEITKEALLLKVKAEQQTIAGEVVLRRLEALAKAIGRRAQIIPE
ncbi:Ppx/GppA family phosphatase [Govanella unica]|uniref:Ppx/GppA family phosphatase n=1 Tax=Govanella unica TaxID=2975056 RepID=A0A9X3TZN4_9PROT|nr:Ppx/GppA family phosphatase [Govania unica]MDA5194379.1 Ppx/GppA family phosphatase [Govania unica]